MYRIFVHLLDANGKIIQEYKLSDKFPLRRAPGYPWELVLHTFTGYESDPRYVEINHGGKDTIYWQGYYGADIKDTTIFLCPQ